MVHRGTQRVPGWLLCLGVVGCQAPSELPVYESEFLRVFSADGSQLCAGTLDLFEREAETARMATQSFDRRIDVYYGEDRHCGPVCDTDRNSIAVSDLGYGPGAQASRFLSEYVDALAGPTTPIDFLNFWQRLGGVSVYRDLAASTSITTTHPPNLQAEPAWAPKALAQVDEMPPEAWHVPLPFKYFLIDEYGLDSLREFHRRTRDEPQANIYTVFEESFGETLADASDRFVAVSPGREYTIDGFGTPPADPCTEFVELPLDLSGEQTCDDEGVLGGGGYPTLGSRSVCFTVDTPQRLEIELVEASPNIRVVFSADDERPCDIPDGDNFAGSLKILTEPGPATSHWFGACTYQVRIGTEQGHSPVSYRVRARVDQ